VQLDAVVRYAALAMAIVEETDTDNADAQARALPRRSGMEARVKASAHGFYGGQERARRTDTLDGRHLRNHRTATRVRDDKVHVRILLHAVP
jgi:hypothetical protein